VLCGKGFDADMNGFKALIFYTVTNGGGLKQDVEKCFIVLSVKY